MAGPANPSENAAAPPSRPPPPSGGDGGRPSRRPRPSRPDRKERLRSRPRRLGRVVATALYYGALGVFCVTATVQIAQQVFASPAEAAPFASCDDGLRALARAVDLARGAAPAEDGEDAAVDRFRREVEDAFRHRDAIAQACAGIPGRGLVLDAIERLRYAEEHAARRDAGDLSPLRRQVRTLLEEELRSGSLVRPD